ncbi:class I SAM-dependent methyltransferase [Streptomyces sp. NPDC056500]|uniref:class I SAM-dependent methyltransferase n=1 Tax=Streptomyces sp. NPDC056500 TaxID=3345840 RepID=UPI0036A85583
MGYVIQGEWDQHYTDGKGFRPLGDVERAVLAEHAPAPKGGGRALDVGCGVGDLAVYLGGQGYAVDAVDFAASAIARAESEHTDVKGVRWLRLDIERDDPEKLSSMGYDLITLRLVLPFIRDRARVMHGLGGRLRPGGVLVIITPTAEHTPEDRRDIALDDQEIRLLRADWKETEHLTVDELAVLVLRGPCPNGTSAVR